MRIFLCLVAAVLAAVPARADKPARPIPEIERVVIIAVDGLRPDRLLLAEAPHIRGLMARGAWSMWAQTTSMATTLPSHTSMLTGVTPRKHRIYWNELLPLSEPVWQGVPTLFELARRAGYTTALVAGKAKFRYLAKPGTLNFSFMPERKVQPDAVVADKALEAIATVKPDVLFVHFPWTDEAGHQHGWGSAEIHAAIAEADRQVGRVLAALEQAGLAQSALIILSADHGGAAKSHWPDDLRSRTIPWIAAGPGVKPGHDLTMEADLVINTEDTCVTACYVLGIGELPHFQGKAVRAAFTRAP